MADTTTKTVTEIELRGLRTGSKWSYEVKVWLDGIKNYTIHHSSDFEAAKNQAAELMAGEILNDNRRILFQYGGDLNEDSNGNT